MGGKHRAYLKTKARVTVGEVAREALFIETPRIGTADQRGSSQRRWKRYGVVSEPTAKQTGRAGAGGFRCHAPPPVISPDTAQRGLLAGSGAAMPSVVPIPDFALENPPLIADGSGSLASHDKYAMLRSRCI